MMSLAKTWSHTPLSVFFQETSLLMSLFLTHILTPYILPTKVDLNV